MRSSKPSAGAGREAGGNTVAAAAAAGGGWAGAPARAASSSSGTMQAAPFIGPAYARQKKPGETEVSPGVRTALPQLPAALAAPQARQGEARQQQPQAEGAATAGVRLHRNLGGGLARPAICVGDRQSERVVARA